jgi:hypothetical protein
VGTEALAYIGERGVVRENGFVWYVCWWAEVEADGYETGFESFLVQFCGELEGEVVERFSGFLWSTVITLAAGAEGGSWRRRGDGAGVDTTGGAVDLFSKCSEAVFYRCGGESGKLTGGDETKHPEGHGEVGIDLRDGGEREIGEKVAFASSGNHGNAVGAGGGGCQFGDQAIDADADSGGDAGGLVDGVPDGFRHGVFVVPVSLAPREVADNLSWLDRLDERSEMGKDRGYRLVECGGACWIGDDDAHLRAVLARLSQGDALVDAAVPGLEVDLSDQFAVARGACDDGGGAEFWEIALCECDGRTRNDTQGEDHWSLQGARAEGTDTSIRTRVLLNVNTWCLFSIFFYMLWVGRRVERWDA